MAFDHAAQWENQSISKFISYLHALESHLSDKYLNKQQKQHLYSKILDKVHNNLRWMQGKPEDYNSYIIWVNSAERRIQNCTKILKAYKRNKIKKTKPLPAEQDTPKGMSC